MKNRNLVKGLILSALVSGVAQAAPSPFLPGGLTPDLIKVLPVNCNAEQAVISQLQTEKAALQGALAVCQSDLSSTEQLLTDAIAEKDMAVADKDSAIADKDLCEQNFLAEQAAHSNTQSLLAACITNNGTLDIDKTTLQGQIASQAQMIQDLQAEKLALEGTIDFLQGENSAMALSLDELKASLINAKKSAIQLKNKLIGNSEFTLAKKALRKIKKALKLEIFG